MGMFTLKKGHDIPLKGQAERRIESAQKSPQIAVQPIDFRGLRPAVKVEPGNKVKRGSILFVDKQRPEIVFRSPAAGTVHALIRGERRVLQRITVDVGSDSAESFQIYSENEIKTLNGDQAKTILLNSGLWPALRQRPYSRIANPDQEPKAIFISAVDSAPLQAETDFLLEGRKKDFQFGITFLSRLSGGKIHVSASPATAAWFEEISGIELHTFKGPHPAGNISVQVHHIDRIRSGDVIWYISPRHVAQIGKMLNTGEYPSEKIVALTGAELNDPHYVKTIEGAQISALISEPLDKTKQRVISGNVLSGSNVSTEGFVGFYDDMVTVIPEILEKRFFGWLRLGFTSNSYWRTFFSALTPSKKLSVNTGMNGEERAFVATGEYEKVMPMDILPMHLAKAILVEDIELMEQLGIYEVDPEDFALCSYICPSKIEFGEIIEKGIVTMEKEG